MKWLAILLLCLVGCSNEVPCSECNGTGQVVYDENHPIVKLGHDPGTYTCPICQGEGVLIRE